MKDNLKKWIKSTKINTKHFGFMMIGFDLQRSPRRQIGKPLANNISKKSKWKPKANKKVKPKTKQENKNKSKPAVSSQDERKMLQEGLISKDISDDDLVPFFENDLKASEENPDVRGIPPGETVFIMCVLKGKTRPITAFIDSGCNCFVAKEDVVKNELNAFKARDGPIPMGVAGGKTVAASGEWAAVLPLLDGGHQVVKGLTMDKLTLDMPKVNLRKLLDACEEEYGPVEAIQGYKAPEIVGGSMDMIMGICYQNIYPESIYTYPNGLAVYKTNLW